MHWRARASALAPLALAASLISAQSPLGDMQAHPKAKPLAVAFLYPEQVTVVADKPSSVELHFKVASGLHINSHTPRTDDLIPTTLKLPETSGVHVADTAFPAGEDLLFGAGGSSTEKLSVYTDEFTVRAELVAPRGEHLVEGTLRYQACDNHACMPPHSIPVVFDVIAR